MFWVLALVTLEAICGKEVRGQVGEEDLPEFFDDSQNVIFLVSGFGIILLSVLIAVLIYKFKGRSAAFENSLFQNLEDEN